MLAKRIYPDSFDFDFPVAKLMEVHSRGVDKDWMRKRAAMFDDIIIDIRPKKGHSLIHIVTTGAMETYGCNANTDAFPRRARTYNIPHPEEGCDSSIQLDGGLDKYHSTYRDGAYVYKNHRDNKDPNARQGEIVHETINDGLDRGELIIEVPDAKWRTALENLANDRPVYFSQGCGVPYDICSLCGHKRRSFPEACDCIKRHKLEITSDGYQIFVINDRPGFHDISEVIKPADKIAFALRKVASGEVLDSVDLAILDGYSLPALLSDRSRGRYDRLEKLRKLAELEKQIMTAGDDAASCAFCGESGFKDVENKAAETISRDPSGCLGGMNGAKIVLPVELFLKLLAGKEIGGDQLDSLIPEVKSLMPSLFSDMLEEEGLNDIVSDGSYDGDGCQLPKELENMEESHSVSFGPVKRRATLVTITKRPGEPPKEKITKISSEAGPAARFAAREYGKYLIAVNRFCSDPFEERMSVVQKFM